MNQSNFSQLLALKRHTCEATREGDWIIHRCPKCDYALWNNWRTGELKVFNANAQTSHSGFYVPAEFEELKENSN